MPELFGNYCDNRLIVPVDVRVLDAARPPPAAAAARPAPGSSIARTLRTAWWPRFAVTGLVLVVVGVTLLSGAAQGLVAVGGMVVFACAAAVGLAGKSWEQDRRREPPVPPGSGDPFPACDRSGPFTSVTPGGRAVAMQAEVRVTWNLRIR